MPDDEARIILEEVAILLATNRTLNAREQVVRIQDYVNRRPLERAPGSERDRGDNGVTYKFCTFRYIDRMDAWVEDWAEKGFVVEWINSYHSLQWGGIEHLVCMVKGNEQR